MRYGIRAYIASDPNTPWPNTRITSTKVRPMVGESIMLFGQRVRIVDIAVNTGENIQDLLYLFVEKL